MQYSGCSGLSRNNLLGNYYSRFIILTGYECYIDQQDIGTNIAHATFRLYKAHSRNISFVRTTMMKSGMSM